MSVIFSNASITLAAAAASNSHGGLFRVCRTTAALGLNDDRGMPIYMRQFPDTHFFLNRQYREQLEFGRPNSPLMQRAWVFQNGSSRAGFCYSAARGLSGNARQQADSESGHAWINHEIREQVIPGGDDGEETRQRALLGRWHSLVTEYTCLSLSFVSDTLPRPRRLGSDAADTVSALTIALDCGGIHSYPISSG